jgi:ElaA protein
MRLEWKEFAALSAGELYEILRLRNEVFVVEQNCVYQDCDGHDPSCLHLLGRSAEGALVAYLRMVPAGLKYNEASLGRVATASAGRAQGLGKLLVAEGVRAAEGRPLRISAQAYLEKFYEGFGFRGLGDTYLEDGIPHREMYCEMMQA